MATAFALSMLGIASMVGGVTITAIGASQPSSASALPIAVLVAVVAGGVLDLIGAGLMSSAVPHLYDAVNAYNDGAPGSGKPQADR